MSRSWTELLRPASPRSAGIVIGRDQLCAAVVATGGEVPELLALQAQALAEPLFEASPTPAAENALVQALRSLSESFRDGYGPVHVALPDTVLRSAVLELDEVPKTVALRQDLLRWRFAKQWQRPEDSLDCQGCVLGKDGTPLLFGQAGDGEWIACVRRALARAGVMAWSMNAATVYRFNGHHAQLTRAAGALLALDPDSWTVWLWDDEGRVRHVLTRLRDPQAGSDAASAIADEVERAVVAYVQADGGRRVGRLHLAGSKDEIAAMARVFDARLREPALPLEPRVVARAGVAVRDGLAPLALITALSS